MQSSVQIPAHPWFTGVLTLFIYTPFASELCLHVPCVCFTNKLLWLYLLTCSVTGLFVNLKLGKRYCKHCGEKMRFCCTGTQSQVKNEEK